MNSVVNSAQHAASQAVDQVRSSANETRASLLDLGVQALKFVNHLRVNESRVVDSALDRIGLQRRESAMRPALWFAAGAVVAGGAALVLAPSSGEKLRKRLIELLSKAGDTVKQSVIAKEVVTDVKQVRDTLRDAKDHVAKDHLKEDHMKLEPLKGKTFPTS
jgi:gas vesicle protein